MLERATFPILKVRIPRGLWAVACCAALWLVGAASCRAQFSLLPDADEAMRMAEPEPDQLFRLESEQQLQERIRREAPKGPKALPVVFPKDPVFPETGVLVREWPARVCQTVPAYVCYKRLYFEQLNYERYGWSLGVIDPVLSAGAFFLDVATLPYHMGTEPCRCYECSAGYCLPGDPVPLRLYRPKLSATGLAAQVGVVAGLLAIFP